MSVKISDRTQNPGYQQQLENAGIHALLARLWASRGVNDPAQTQAQWQNMLAPSLLSEVNRAANLLADAIEQRKKLLIIADYDCDGATACATGVRALRQMGADIDFLVPNRFETGYGLSPAVVKLACQHPNGKPDILITVDNGIASVEGVQAARDEGMAVIVTDHHLPGDTLPDALCIVNPNKPGCTFPSKNLAGVGVIFYVMLALRAQMRQRGHFPPTVGPGLTTLPTCWRWAPLRMLFAWTAITACWLPKDSTKSAGATCSPASRPCSWWRGAISKKPVPPTWVLKSARASMLPVVWQT